MMPMTVAELQASIKNGRTATQDLDSVYGAPQPPDPDHPDRLLIGRVDDLGDLPEPETRPRDRLDDNDVPREPCSNDITHDRAALIGDPRNDENTIISQLQVAFLKAHNGLSMRALAGDLRAQQQCADQPRRAHCRPGIAAAGTVTAAAAISRIAAALDLCHGPTGGRHDVTPHL
jgi:hypothetical protein